MNTDRLIKVLEWRPSISVSSDGTFNPQDRKEIDECMMDVFKQFYEFKKKKYDLTLDTPLDTDKLEDMDIAILICSIECGFGIKNIPSEELREMTTFRSIADYISHNLPPKTASDTCPEKDEHTETKDNKNYKIGFFGWIFSIGATCFAIWFFFNVFDKAYDLPTIASAVLSVIIGVIVFAITVGMILSSNKNG